MTSPLTTCPGLKGHSGAEQMAKKFGDRMREGFQAVDRPFHFLSRNSDVSCAGPAYPEIWA